jgi:hypothetical protein
MRPILLVAAMFILLTCMMPNLSFGQWIDYTSKTDFFYVNFPGQPNVRDIMYKTQYGIMLPGQLYSVDQGASHYSVTVVDYADAQKIHTARAEQCKKAGGKAMSAGAPGPVMCRERSSTRRGSLFRGTRRSRTMNGPIPIRSAAIGSSS